MTPIQEEGRRQLAYDAGDCRAFRVLLRKSLSDHYSVFQP